MRKSILQILLISVMFLSGCSVGGEVTQPTPISPTASMTASLSQTLTSTVTPTNTPTLTPLPTLSQEEAVKKITELMQTNAGCPQPCFWGIRPFSDTFYEALNYFNKFGGGWFTGKMYPYNFHSTGFSFKENMRIDITLQENNGDFRQIEVYLYGLDEPDITNQDWLAYRPDSILRAYGLPTNIQILLPEPATPPGQEIQVLYAIIFIYDEQHFVVEYDSAEHFPVIDSKVHVCPLLDNELQQTILWLGKDLPDFEKYRFDLEKVTSMKMGDFFTLMTGDPEKACFDVYYE